MPDRGKIDPQRVRTSQSDASEFFNSEPGVPQRTIADTVREIEADPSKADSIKPIRLIERDGHIYTLDHRRLIAFRRLGLDVPYVRVDYDRLSRKLQNRIDGASEFNENGAFIPNSTTRVRE